MVKEFGLTPDQIYNLDQQVVADWITISNYEAAIQNEKQKGSPA